MKKIIDVHIPAQEISIERMHATKDSNTVVAYKTNSDNALAVLHSLDDGSYGFIYYEHLVRRANKDNAKFVSQTMNGALRSVIASGREVFMFSGFDEFAAYAGDIAKGNLKQ